MIQPVTNKATELFRALFGRHWWWVTLLVILIMLGLARLGIWQLDRLEQRREANRALAAALAQDPLDLANDPLPEDFTSIRNRLAVASGRFDFDNQVMLKVQNWGGRAGANLITPLVFADGKTAVLVDRGWIPEADNNPEGRAEYDVSGPVTIQGYVALSQTLPNAAAPEQPQEQWYRVDIEGIQAQMPYKLLPIYVLQAPEDNEVPPFRSAPDLDLSEGNHLSYAIQWFIFSIGLGIGYVVYVNNQINKSVKHEA